MVDSREGLGEEQPLRGSLEEEGAVGGCIKVKQGQDNGTSFCLHKQKFRAELMKSLGFLRKVLNFVT